MADAMQLVRSAGADRLSDGIFYFEIRHQY